MAVGAFSVYGIMEQQCSGLGVQIGICRGNTMIDYGLKGRVVLITGVNNPQGIGAGREAKLLLEHGDITALSIYANKLQQAGANVLHGAIREVSLVLAGANPGAYIEDVNFALIRGRKRSLVKQNY